MFTENDWCIFYEIFNQIIENGFVGFKTGFVSRFRTDGDFSCDDN